MAKKDRQGFVLYNEDLRLLRCLPDADALSVIWALQAYSDDLTNGKEPAVPALDRNAMLFFEVMSEKILRDHQAYVDKCERNAANRRAATTVNDRQPSCTNGTETETETETELELELEPERSGRGTRPACAREETARPVQTALPDAPVKAGVPVKPAGRKSARAVRGEAATPVKHAVSASCPAVSRPAMPTLPDAAADQPVPALVAADRRSGMTAPAYDGLAGYPFDAADRPSAGNPAVSASRPDVSRPAMPPLPDTAPDAADLILAGNPAAAAARPVATPAAADRRSGVTAPAPAEQAGCPVDHADRPSAGMKAAGATVGSAGKANAAPTLPDAALAGGGRPGERPVDGNAASAGNTMQAGNAVQVGNRPFVGNAAAGAAPVDPQAPPTARQVADYAAREGLNINAARFCSYYAARGWCISGQPMKDWQAAVRTWVSRDEPSPAKPRGKVVAEQCYTQRPYTHSDDAADALMNA